MQAKSFAWDSVKCVDIVNGVINVAVVRWVAEQIVSRHCDTDILPIDFAWLSQSTKDEVLGGYPADDWATPTLNRQFCRLAEWVYVPKIVSKY